MENAKESIVAANEAADNLVDTLVAQNIAGALNEAISKVSSLEENKHKRDSFVLAMKNLKIKFENFQSKPQDSYEVTKEAIEVAYAQYINYYREVMDSSWNPISIDHQFKSLPKVLSSTLSHIREQCDAGISIDNFENIVQSSEDLPKYEFDWEIMLNLSADYTPSYADYQAYNYLEENSTRTFLFDASKYAFAGSTGVASIQGAAYLNTFMAGGTLASAELTGAIGTASNAAMAIMPYAAAAMVVMALIMDISARNKLDKLQRQKAAADVYKIKNTRRSQWLKAEYATRCETMKGLLSTLITDLNFVANNISNQKALSDYYTNDLMDLKNAYSKMEDFKTAKQMLKLESLYNKKLCVSEGVYKNIDPDLFVSAKSSIPKCYASPDNSTLHLVDGNHSQLLIKITKSGKLDIDQKFIQSSLNEFKSKDGDTFSDNKKIFATNSMYIRYKIYEMFVVQRKSIMNSMKSFSGSYLSKVQTQAFNRLLNLISVYRNFKSRPIDKILNDELDAQKEYSTLVSEFNDLLNLSTNYIFGKVKKSVVRLKSMALNQKMSSFYDRYVYIAEVTDLMRDFKGYKQSLGFKH